MVKYATEKTRGKRRRRVNLMQPHQFSCSAEMHVFATDWNGLQKTTSVVCSLGAFDKKTASLA